MKYIFKKRTIQHNVYFHKDHIFKVSNAPAQIFLKDIDIVHGSNFIEVTQIQMQSFANGISRRGKKCGILTRLFNILV